MRFDERVRTLLADVGAILDVYVIDEHEDESFWHIALDAETIFFAEIDHHRGLFILSCDVGSPLPHGKAELYETVLSYNHHWYSTAGARLTLSTPNGAVWLWSEFAVERLDRDAIATWFKDYRKKIRAWKTLIGQGAPAAGRADDMPEFLESKGFIRG